MVTGLLTTKLFLPQTRAERVVRQRLLAQFDEALHPGMRLVLISAPAGFGKTTLLAEWLVHSGLPCAWLALDGDDNTPRQFLTYLLAAIARVLPGQTHETQALLDASRTGQETTTPKIILQSLINELAALPAQPPLIVALDDFQAITSAEIRESMVYLLENLPQGVRLAVASRSDPPFPLARLRARGQMVELRAADLQFSSAEAAELLRQTMRASEPLPEQTVQMLIERTEGWAAGLQMAALAIKTAPVDGTNTLLQNFSGSHRFVLDYLAEEVLSRLPEATLTFLLETSILARFDAALSAEVAREAFASPGEAQAQALLEELDRANLFLIALDDERRWFRYHHLFADLLRTRLKANPPAAPAVLHQRAAAWFEQSGLPTEAIRHALAAGEAGSPEAYPRAVRLVEQHAIELLRRGALNDVSGWIQLLPPERSAERPMFHLAHAWTNLFAGRIPDALELAQQAEARRDSLSTAEQTELAGYCSAIRCHAALMMGALADVDHYAARVETVFPDPALWARTFTTWTVGYSARIQGELDRAAACFLHVYHTGVGQHDPWGTAMGATDLGVVRRIQGRLCEAREVFDSALAMLEQHRARSHGYTARLLTAYAQVLYDQNSLEDALSLLREAKHLTARWENPNHGVYTSLGLVRLYSAQGNFTAAQAEIRDAEALARLLPVVQTLASSLQVARGNVDLAQGIVPGSSPALQAMLNHIETQETPASEAALNVWSYCIRALLANSDFPRALRLAEIAARATHHSGRITACLEFTIAQALAAYFQGQSETALTALEHAASLAEPEGIVRPFLDIQQIPGGEAALTPLLEGLRRRRPHYSGFAARLLGQDKPPPADTQADRGTQHVLVEPLSEREREVLRLMAEGLTNAQIAERLILSTGTIKAHTANIFRKLDASNRTQAVALARAWKLL